MKVLFFLLVGFVGFTAGDANFESLIQSEWELYKLKYNKVYNKDEDSTRMWIYVSSRVVVTEHNIKYANGEVTYEMGINKFSDMSSQEVNNMYNKVKENEYAPGDELSIILDSIGAEIDTPALNITVPDEVNWVTKGAVSKVYDQGNCGSCYAFASTGALESALFIKTGRLMPLSMQNLVDCSQSAGNNGCNGGSISNSYLYVHTNDGINDFDDYPYEAKEGTCRFDPTKPVGHISGYHIVGKNNEKALKVAVAFGPVAASIDASPASFHKYKGGIYSDSSCGEQINHGILIVGYGHDTEADKDYWLIKNSWGDQWGEEGYMKMARNENNMCNIAFRPILPVV